MHINYWQYDMYIKLYRPVRGCEVVNCILVAQNLIEWQTLVNRVMNLNITQKGENYGNVSGSDKLMH
jgi:hypothetical protein